MAEAIGKATVKARPWILVQSRGSCGRTWRGADGGDAELGMDAITGARGRRSWVAWAGLGDRDRRIRESCGR